MVAYPLECCPRRGVRAGDPQGLGDGQEMPCAAGAGANRSVQTLQFQKHILIWD